MDFPLTCHHDGRMPVRQLSTGATLYGASRYAFDPTHADIILDLAGNLDYIRDGFVHGPRRFRNQLNHLAPLAEIVRFHWDDLTVPPASGAFWRALLPLLGNAHVAITCLGGHGRTGTALAALCIADGYGAQPALHMVRAAYCSQAVETRDQERYLEALEHDCRSREEAL